MSGIRYYTVQKFLMDKQGVSLPTDLNPEQIDGTYTISDDDYDYIVVVKDKKIFSDEMTPESKVIYQMKKEFAELMEQRAEELAPGEENYCYHDDKKLVYYGGDWEDEEDKFFTVEQLTTGFEAQKEKIKNDLIESRKDHRMYSFNDIVEMYKYSKKLEYESFLTFLEEKILHNHD